MATILPNNNTGLYNTTGNTGPVIFNEYGNANVANYLPTYSGNISSANIGLSGIFTNNYYYANGAPVSFAGTYSNANVAAFLPIYSGNISGGNVTISGVFNGNGSGLTAITGANVTGTVANATLAVSATTAGTVTTAAQPNITSVGTLTVATVSGNVTAGGNISGNYILGNGSQLTGLPAQYGNANVAAFLPTYTGNLAGGNITVSGVVAGSGAGLTNIPGANVTGTVANAAYATAAGSAGSATTATTAGTVTTAAQPNITSVGTMVSLTATGNVSGGNLVTLGNVSGAYILGNGSQLTGLPENYGNANVVSLLAGFGSNTISTTGNVTGGNLVTLGNVSGAYILGNGSQLTGLPTAYGNSNVANFLTTYTGNLAAGNISVAEDVFVAGDVTAGVFYGTFAGNISGNLSVPGSNTWVLYNNAGNAGADSNFRFDSATDTLTVNGIGNIVAINSTDITFTGNLSGSGAALTNLPGANVTGTVANAAYATTSGSAATATTATTANTVIDGTQANITSVGTLTSLSVSGNISGGNISTSGVFTGSGAGLTSIPGANVSGTVANAAYATTSGSATSATTANTVTNAAQANITSVGTLTSLAVSGNATVSGNVVASVVQASNSGGLALKNAGGTTQASMGAGGGDNFAINVSTNLNGTNAQIDISPTGTGHVHIKPSGTGAVEIAPVNPGTINNMVIGNATPLAANFTTVSTTGNVTAAGNVSGSYILGNGSQLTGVISSYGNANVAAYLPTYTGAMTAMTGNLTTTANVAGGNVLATGEVIATGDVRSGSGQSVWAGSVEIENDSVSPAAIKIKGQTDVIGGLAAQYVTVATGNVYGANLVSGGRIDATGNITGAYIIGNGSLLTNITAANISGTVANAAYATNASTVTNPAQANITSVGTLTSLTSSGNITGGNVIVDPATGKFQIGVATIGNFNNRLLFSDAELSGVLNFASTGQIAASGNITTPGAISATGNITATGNVQGAYLKGNAAFITGLNSFSTVNANGTSLVAVTASDTLTITPGTNIGITGNAGTDTVTINNLYGNANVLTYVSNTLLPSYPGNLIPNNVQVNGSFTSMANTIYVGQPGPGGTGLFGPWNSLAYIVLDANNVAIGNGAGSNQQDRSISIGWDAGVESDEDCVAIGAEAARFDQKDDAIAIGTRAGYSSQQAGAIAIGEKAGNTTQGSQAVAIGVRAGRNTQSSSAVAIGGDAGQITQGLSAVAVGPSAGTSSQGNSAVAVGASAGGTSQGIQAVAIGTSSGLTSQGNNAIAIGYIAGYNNQGAGAIAIGTGAGNNAQAANSIVINATSNSAVTLDAVNAGLYINPVRNDAANVAQTIYYNTTTKEFTYAASVSPGVTSPGGSNTQIQYNNAGSFGGASVFAFNNSTGNVTAGNIVIQANTTTTGAAQNIYTNSNQYLGNSATTPLLGRMLFGSGLATTAGGSGDFSNNVDISSNMRGARMILADRYQKTDTGVRSRALTISNFVDISGNIGTANANSRLASLATEMFIGGGNSVSTNPSIITSQNAAITLGTNGNATVGNTAVTAATSHLAFTELRPNSSVTSMLAYNPSLTNSTGNATAWTNAYGISPSTGGNAAIANFSLVHMQNASGLGWGVSSTVPPTNYYFLNNQDVRSESIVGPIRQYQDKTYLEATGSGTVAVDWDNGTSQVINLTGDMTLTFQDPTVGTTNQRLIHTVTLVIYQDATGRAVTLPTASSTYRYAGGTSTVGTTASSVTMITVSAIRVSGATQYLITVSPEFTG